MGSSYLQTPLQRSSLRDPSPRPNPQTILPSFLFFDLGPRLVLACADRVGNASAIGVTSWRCGTVQCGRCTCKIKRHTFFASAQQKHFVLFAQPSVRAKITGPSDTHVEVLYLITVLAKTNAKRYCMLYITKTNDETTLHTELNRTASDAVSGHNW